MKTALLLSLVCAAAVLNGCSSTNQGGTEDTYYSQSGSREQTEPMRIDPSIPQTDGEAGSQIPPP